MKFTEVMAGLGVKELTVNPDDLADMFNQAMAEAWELGHDAGWNGRLSHENPYKN
ncbi:hypothetical protein [Nocardia grenadensis]|uniref:hypothetical protein n=1 Tax=Nocardia grenadensis TaxID=931537 RepID=UPI003D7549D6